MSIFGTLSLVLVIFASIVGAKKSCPSGTFQGIKGDCFWFNNTKANWGDALSFCANHKGDLAAIDSAFENAKITSELRNLTNNVSQKLWIGGYIETDCNSETGICEKNWNWSDSEDFYYQNWNVNGNSDDTDDPNNAAIDIDTGTWFAVNQDQKLAFLCKYTP